MISLVRLSFVVLFFLLGFSTTVFALPDLYDFNQKDADSEYELDTSHGDPFSQPYNVQRGGDDPQNLEPEHDTAYDFYLFEPRRRDGAPIEPRPLIVYFHGGTPFAQAEDVRAQIEHYVRTGSTVVYPQFCDSQRFCLDFVNYMMNAMTSIVQAHSLLGQGDHVEIVPFVELTPH